MTRTRRPERIAASDKPPPKIRTRKCAASGEILPESRLIRFALGPDKSLVPDLAAKVPGRGVWVEARRDRIEQARKKGGFARSLKAELKISDDVADLTEALLFKRCLDHLGLIRRAGALAIGQSQVEAAIRKAPVWLSIEASDGAEDGRTKLANLYFGLWSRHPAMVGCFSAAELGMALGRDRVIHACVLQERLARAWAAELSRLSGFRAIVPDSWPESWRSVGLGLGDAGAEPSGSEAASGAEALLEDASPQSAGPQGAD